MKKIFFVIFCGLFLAACNGGKSPVTEVLNPSQSPVQVKYAGQYKSTVFAPVEQNLLSEVSFEHVALKCQSNESLEKLVEEGTDDSTIFYVNFFNYNGVPKSIAATLDRTTGITRFEAAGDDQNKINCNGQFALSEDQKVLLALDCDVVGVKPEECMVTAQGVE